MKKIYLCTLLLFVGVLLFGQYAKQTTIPFKNKSINTTTKSPKDKGLTLWSDDFSSISTWNLTNTSTPSQNWIYATDPTIIPTITPNAVGLTTASNGYLYIDSDDLGTGSFQNVFAENATAIDLSGKPNVRLIWEQHYISLLENFNGKC